MNKLTWTLPGAALALLTSIGAHAAISPALLASTDSVDDATRTVVIAPDTKYVNVQYGEVVKFVDNGQAFAVRFDGIRNNFGLGTVAPAGSLDHQVTVFVAPDVGAED